MNLRHWTFKNWLSVMLAIALISFSLYGYYRLAGWSGVLCVAAAVMVVAIIHWTINNFPE